MSENQSPLAIDPPKPLPTRDDDSLIDDRDQIIDDIDEALGTPANEDAPLTDAPLADAPADADDDLIDQSDAILGPGDYGKQVGSAIKASRDLDGDTAAEILGLHKKTGLPKDAIEENLAEIRIHESDRELDGLAQKAADEHPVTSEFVTKDRYHAAVSDGDVGVLATIEQIVDAAFSEEAARSIYRQAIVESVAGAYNFTIRSPIENAAQREKERAELEAAAARPDASLDTKIASVVANLGSLIPDPVEKLVEGSVALTEQINAAFGGEARDVQEAVRVQSKAADEYLKSLAPKSKSGELNYYVTEIIGGTAGMVPTILISVWGGVRTALSEIGIRVFGLSYNEGRNKGLTPQQAAIRAAHLGAFEMLTESLPLKEILKPISRVNRGTFRGLTERASNILKAGGLESVQEGLATIFQILYDTMVLDEDFDVAKAYRNTLDAMIIGGGAGGLSATGTNFAGAVMDRQRAKQVQERTAEILDRSRESILRERSPDAFDEFFQTLADDYERANINVSAAPIMDYLMQQGEDPVQFFGELGVSEQTVRDAYENGDDIEIKAGKFFSLMPDNEYRDQILLNLRENANTPTLAEAEIRTEQMTQRMEQVLAELDSEEEASVRQAAERVRNRFTQDAIAAGRSRAEAPRDAAVWEAMFVTALDAYRNDPNRTADSRPLSEIAQELEEQVFNVRVRSVPFAERGQPLPLEQTPQEQRQRFRDTLAPEVSERVVAAANEEATDRINLGVDFDAFDTFDIDQIITEELDLGVMEDGYVSYGSLMPADVVIPDDAVEGDRLPLSAAVDDALLYMSDGRQTEGRFWREAAQDDFEIDIIQLFRNDDGTIDLDDTFVELVPKDIDALARRFGDERIAESQVNSIDDALNHEDHLVRAKAFGTLLDELGIDYTTDGSTVASFYYYVGTGQYDAELDEYTDQIKVRFADHENQSRNHPTAEFNVADGGYDTAIDAVNFILRERGMMEAEDSFQTADPANANILHQTITDATGKPLAVVHNISEEKLRHAAKMGGLPVPSLAIVDANQEFTNFGNIQLVAAPSMVDPRASRRNRVFDADIYSPRYPSGDIERTVDDDAADAAQAELDAIADELGLAPFSPGWLRGKLSDSGVKYLSDERLIQIAFLRSIGVKQRIEATEDAIEGREGAFNQFIEDTYGSLITQERILDQITDTGRRYLPHNLDNVVRIMKRELRGGERFTYGVGSIRAQVAKQFKSLKEIKDARESIVTEADMQAFKDDTDDAFGELAQDLSSFYSGDPNQFGFLDVVVDLLSDYARRGERALDQSGFENVSDEAKQKIVNFLANLRQAPTEYFEAKIQRAVGLDEFQGAIVPPETPQDIRTLLEENGLRVVEATDRSQALQDFFYSELFQTGETNQLAAAQARLRDEPETLGLTPESAARVNNIYRPETLPTERLPSNREAALWLEGEFIGEPITDMTQELTDEQIEEVAQIMAAETQLGLEKSGSAFDWYTAAIERALDIIKIKYPMVADDAAAAEAGLGTSKNARFVLTYIMAVTSQNLDVAANAVATDQAFGQMLELIKNGIYEMPREWGTGDKQEAMGDNFDKFGPMIAAMPGDTFPEKIEALDRIFRRSMTVKEWVQYMDEEGIPYNPPGQTAVDAVVYGSSALGPKIGNGFWQNLNGNFDPLTIDLWMRRTWGRLTGASIGNPGALPAQRQRLKDSIKRSRSRAQGDPDHIAKAVDRITEIENMIETRDPTAFVEDLVNAIATIEEDTFTEEARLELEALDVETFTGPILARIEALDPDDFENRKAFNDAKRALREEVKRAKAIYADEKARIRDDIKEAKVEFRDEKQRLRDALRDRKAAFKEEGKRLKAELDIAIETVPDLRNIKAPEPYRSEYDDSPEELLEYAKRLLTVWDAEYKRLKETSNSGKVSADLQPTWARAAKTIVTNLAKPLDQVANGTQRKQIEKAGARALEILADADVPMTMADMQAVLWYPEKDLWGALTTELATDEDGLPVVPPSNLNESYDTVFTRILRSQGFEVEGIAGARAGGDGARTVAGQDAQLEGPESSQGAGTARGEVRGRGQEELFQTVDPPPSGIRRLYSQAQRATETLTQQKATASQWLSHFKKNGVKDDELNWVVGLEEFLNSQKTIDKDDLLEFIQQNGIKLDEVQLGGPEKSGGESIFLTEARESAEEAAQELAFHADALSNALRDIGFTEEGVQDALTEIDLLDGRALTVASIVQGAEEASPGIMDLAAFYQQAEINLRIARETLEIEETEERDSDFVRFKRYTLDGPLEAPNQEFYLTLPADLTKGNADVEDWVVPEFHKIGDEVADNRLVIRIRANGRVLEDGRRVLFIEEMQDDRGQEASKQGVRERVSNLSARQQAYREAEIDAKTVMAKYFTGVEDIPTSERFSYLENVMKLAAGYEQYGERWVTSLNFRDFDFTPEEIEVVDRFIELNATEPDEVKLGDSYSMFRDGIPDRPFLQLNKVVPLALKRMMVEATERGYDAIAWTPGEIQTERYNMSRIITMVDVVEVNDEEAMIIANQGSFGPVALEGVQTETMSFEPEYDLYQDEETGEWTISSDGGVLLEYGFPTFEDAEEALDNIRQQDELIDGPIINMVPRAKLAEFFGKEFADKIIEGGRGQTYDNLEVDVGGTNHKKFYNKIVVNTANKLGKKFKAKTGVGKVVVQEAQPGPYGEFTVGSEYYVRSFDDGFQVRQRDAFGDVASLSRLFETREEAEQELAAGAVERALDPEVPAERYFVFNPDGRTLESFFDKASAENYARVYNEAQTGELPAVTEDVWVLPLTDQLKDTILGEGLPLMQDPDDPLGSFDPVRRVINLFEQANYSTLLHESGHAFVNIMEELSKRDDAPARITENYQAMLEWTGATSAADLDVRINGEAAREKQERLARAFEAYLREGKAPSAKLQSAFSQFKEWLKKIYQNLTQLNVTMDDEIRTVFDRMLATDAEIADMAAAREFTMEDSPSILAMMDAEEREKAQRLQLAARDRAREARALDEARYAALLASAKYEEELELVREEETDKLYMERAYGAFYFLTRGELFGDRSTPEVLAGKRIARSAMLEAGFTPEELRALPRMYRNGGKAVYTSNEADAADPEFLAAYLGYESGVELMAALRTIVFPEDEINRRAEEIMKSRPDYQDPANDGTLSQITEDALYNAEQAELIEIELDALARTAGMQRESRLFLQAVADRMFAEELVGDMLSPVKFAAASRRAARAAEQAANRGDAQKAFVEKRKELLNFELHRRAIKARKEVTSINNKLRRLQRRKLNPKTYDTSYHGHIKTLLAFYEFGTSRRTKSIKPEEMANILDFINSMNEFDANLVMPAELLEFVEERDGRPVFAFKTKHWTEMTLPELRGIRDMADNFMHVAKDKSAENEAVMNELADLLAGHIKRNTTKKITPFDTTSFPTEEDEKKSIKDRSIKFYYEHRKLNSLMRQLDGFVPNGPMQQAIHDGLARARDYKHLMLEKLVNDTEKAFGHYTRKERKQFGSKKSAVIIGALRNSNHPNGQAMTREHRVSIALNWGNESSREAVLDDAVRLSEFGAAWNEDTINEILATLTEADLNFVEDVWRMIDQFWNDFEVIYQGETLKIPGIASLEKEFTGFAPPKVQPVPFEVNGRVLAGGYFPLRYDSRLSPRVDTEHQERDIMRLTNSLGFARAATQHGFTNARIGSGGRPVRFGKDTIFSHLEDVVHDLAFRKAVTMADRIIQKTAVKEAIYGTIGKEGFQTIRNLIVAIAQSNKPQELSGIDEGVRSLRINATVALMGLNLRVLLTQPAGLFQTQVEIGSWRMTEGYLRFMQHPQETTRLVFAKSVFMRERTKNITRELDEFARTLRVRGASDTVKEMSLRPIGWVDAFTVAIPAWLGAYHKALDGEVEGVPANDEKEAAKYADRVVERTQGSGDPTALAMLQQKNEGWKAASMFGSYFNTTMNLQSEAVEKRKLDVEKGEGQFSAASNLLSTTLMLQAVPAIVVGLMLTNWPSEDEIEEEGALAAWLKWTTLMVANQAAGSVFILRDLVQSATLGFDLSFTPIEGTFGTLTRAGQSLYRDFGTMFEEGEFSFEYFREKTLKAAAQSISLWKGLPLMGAIRSGEAALHMADDELKNEPRNIVEAGQKLLLTGDR